MIKGDLRTALNMYVLWIFKQEIRKFDFFQVCIFLLLWTEI